MVRSPTFGRRVILFDFWFALQPSETHESGYVPVRQVNPGVVTKDEFLGVARIKIGVVCRILDLIQGRLRYWQEISVKLFPKRGV